jgi:hypothetical protein
MSEPTFEQLRIPAALILIIVVLFAYLPRGGADDPASADAVSGPSSSPTAGQPGGAVTATPPGTPIPSATPAPTPAPTATPEPTATLMADTGFEAEVLACRSISGSNCNGELATVPADVAILTALVRFSDASAGDAIAVVLDGPTGTIAGGPYTLGGGGDGYYYSTFNLGGLPGGEYQLIATRNGSEVAETTFRRGD